MNISEINSLLEKQDYHTWEAVGKSLKSMCLKYNLHINFHDLSGVSSLSKESYNALSPFLYHNNQFCNLVKKNNINFKCCIEHKKKLISVCEYKKSPFYGKCYMGIEEIVFPLMVNDTLIAVFCIGVFSNNIENSLEDININSKQYGLNFNNLKDKYSNIVNKDTDFIDEIICQMKIINFVICKLYIDFIRKTGLEGLWEEKQFKQNHIINNAINFINSNYEKDISLKLLSTNANCNLTYLSSQFKRKLGVSITEYINKIRVSKAKHLLDTTTYSISSISQKVGYNDFAYFSRIFKSIEGICPKNYRNLSK